MVCLAQSEHDSISPLHVLRGTRAEDIGSDWGIRMFNVGSGGGLSNAWGYNIKAAKAARRKL